MSEHNILEYECSVKAYGLDNIKTLNLYPKLLSGLN